MGMTRRAFAAGVLALGAAACAPAPTRGRARVVVAGGGFAGSACALALRRLDPRLDVTLVDPDARYVTCPMSSAALVGWRRLDALTLGRDGLRRAGVRYVHDAVVAIDAERRRVRLRGGGALGYERLVVAPGIRLLWGTPAGYDEAAAERMPHAWVAGAQTTRLARRLQALRDGGTVAISVPAGLMRCPPGPYERASVIAAYLKRSKPRSKVLIFDANNHFPQQDRFTAYWQAHYAGLIEWIALVDGGAVEAVDAATSTLRTPRGAQRVDVANVIPAQAPGELALRAGLARGHGWCAVDPASFESAEVERVHVIGDACIAGAMPKAASAAVSQAHACAQAIVARLGGAAPPAPRLDSVCYAQLARGEALSIHARFAVADGTIRALAASDSALGPAREADAAERWYRQIRADAFAA